MPEYPPMPASEAEWQAHVAFNRLAVVERDAERVRVDRLQKLLAYACNVGDDCDPHDAAHSTRDGIIRLQAEIARLRNALHAVSGEARCDEGHPWSEGFIVHCESCNRVRLLINDALQVGAPEEKCPRLLVGIGDDTYDPECALPLGHDGACQPDA